ncbi:PaaI family thioesterase [Pseudoruegeria sp. HB172150]|uniref:PaaI family thioesterase n=1 Tax=Pseudoruegeria sp. HB172150 TaxID=2721164 RepID=UPI0015521549|nr:PaaI family thioesterase [Pseudoruegeria sp. HB172150]
MMDTPEGWKAMKIGGLWQTIGPLLARRDGDGWRYGLATDERHGNVLGLVHGGTVTSLMDHAMTLVAYEACERQPAVTVQMETRFIAAARPGDLLEAAAELRERTGSLLFLDCRIAVGDRAVAAGSAVMKLRRTA